MDQRTRSTRGMLDPTAAWFRRAVTATAATIFAIAFTLSASALIAVAAWANVAPSLRWGVAVLLDASVLLATAGALVERPRGHRGRVAAYWAAVAGLTLTSAALNAAHAWAGEAVGWRQVAGAVLAAVPSLTVWGSAHMIAWTLTATDPELAADAAREATARIEAAEREAAVRIAVGRTEAHAAEEIAAMTPTPAEVTVAPAPQARTRQAATTTAPAQPRAVVDDRVREQALAMRTEGSSERAIAQALGLSKSSVHRLLASTAGGGNTSSLLEAVA